MYTKKHLKPAEKAKPWAVLAGTGFLSAAILMTPLSETQSTHSMIVQGSNLATVKLAAIASVGGKINHELGVFDAFGIKLSQHQINDLGSINGTRIGSNGTVKTAGAPQPDSFFCSFIETDRLHDEGITGSGVAVAIVDTGAWKLYYNSRARIRMAYQDPLLIVA